MCYKTKQDAINAVITYFGNNPILVDARAQDIDEQDVSLRMDRNKFLGTPSRRNTFGEYKSTVYYTKSKGYFVQDGDRSAMFIAHIGEDDNGYHAFVARKY